MQLAAVIPGGEQWGEDIYIITDKADTSFASNGKLVPRLVPSATISPEPLGVE